MKTVLVTGGSRGIGKSISTVLGKNYHVVVGYVTSKDTAAEVVSEIEESDGSASSVEIDISSKESVDKAFTTLEELYGSVDILINNGGITKDNILPRMKEEEWIDVIQTNLTGSFYTSQRAIKQMMKNKWGRIVFISSVVGMSGNQGQANYAASKAGLIAMSKSLALEYGKKNITVNCVSPGFIKSDMTDKISEEHTELLKSRISLNKLGNPEDVANTIAFLSSNMSDYITGETIHVNGGMYFS